MAFGEIFHAGYTAGSPERARWLHLTRSGSQSQGAIWFILPARGASHIIKFSMYTNCPLHHVFLAWEACGAGSLFLPLQVPPKYMYTVDLVLSVYLVTSYTT